MHWMPLKIIIFGIKKKSDEDCEEVKHLPLSWDVGKDVPEDWHKLFDESSKSNFEPFQQD